MAEIVIPSEEEAARHDHLRAVLTLPGGRDDEALILEGGPLLGTVLMRENLLQVEMTDGGEAVIEPL